MPRDTLTKLETNICLARDILKLDYSVHSKSILVWDSGHASCIFDPFENNDQAEQVLKALGIEYIPYADLILEALNIRLKG